ncbi:hypothetical protein FB451DRAFT_1361904 [Mycena latifolia]|nr:hypothetical protein FB451DRAFT_1361904 [Mycena latifolia]
MLPQQPPPPASCRSCQVLRRASSPPFTDPRRARRRAPLASAVDPVRPFDEDDGLARTFAPKALSEFAMGEEILANADNGREARNEVHGHAQERSAQHAPYAARGPRANPRARALARAPTKAQSSRRVPLLLVLRAPMAHCAASRAHAAREAHADLRAASVYPRAGAKRAGGVGTREEAKRGVEPREAKPALRFNASRHGARGREARGVRPVLHLVRTPASPARARVYLPSVYLPSRTGTYFPYPPTYRPPEAHPLRRARSPTCSESSCRRRRTSSSRRLPPRRRAVLPPQVLDEIALPPAQDRARTPPSSSAASDSSAAARPARPAPARVLHPRPGGGPRHARRRGRGAGADVARLYVTQCAPRVLAMKQQGLEAQVKRERERWLARGLLEYA